MILDTSVVFKWYVKKNEQDIAQADLILKKFIQGSAQISVPDLLIYELSNALSCCPGLLLKDKQESMANFFNLGLDIVAVNSDNINKSFKIAQKHKITVYDAIFIVLAENFKTPLITANPKHQKLCISNKIVKLSDYV